MTMLESLSYSITLFKSNPLAFQLCCAMIGLLIGSFLNVVIHRLPKILEREWNESCLEFQGLEIPSRPKYTLSVPRSSCPHCSHQITALENIPVISYLILKGKCKGCRAPISFRYPFVELLAGTLSFGAAYTFGVSLLTLFAIIFVLGLIALTFIDLDTQLLPDDITLPLLWIGLVANINNGFASLQSAVIGAIVGYLALWTMYWIFKLITGKEGMGHGDFKLLAVIGAWFGWKMVPIAILSSSIVGTIIGLSLILFKGNTRETAYPFGPYLALSGLLGLFCGQSILSVI